VDTRAQVIEPIDERRNAMSERQRRQRVVLCASRTAYRALRKCGRDLANRGFEIVLPADIGAESDVNGTSNRKPGSFTYYHEEIAKSDAVLVVNEAKDGTANYIGPHTLIEMALAHVLRRPIFLLNPLPDQVAWLDELQAMDVEILDGHIDELPRRLAEHTPQHSVTQPDSLSRDFKLERLKFILQQIDRLNERYHKHVILYQSVAAAIIGAAATVFVAWRKLGIDAATARTAILALIWLLLVTALFVVLSVVTGIRAWFDFRREEVKLFDDAVRPGYRDPPSWKNWPRWAESWLIAIVLISALLLSVFAGIWLLPLVG